MRRVSRSLLSLDLPTIWLYWFTLSVFILLPICAALRAQIKPSLFFTVEGAIPASLLLLGLLQLVTFPLMFLQELEAIPRCRNCKSWMTHKSRWTRFAHTNAAFNHGFSDCLAALRENLWEDAAKLRALHGDEYSLSITNTVVEPPIRFHLDFFECQRCDHQSARITTEDKDEDRWTTRGDYVSANKFSAAQAPRRMSLYGLNQTFRALVHAAGMASPRPNELDGVLIVIGALGFFLLIGWLIFVGVEHPWTALHPWF
jgi:hypothetical protein